LRRVAVVLLLLAVAATSVAGPTKITEDVATMLDGPFDTRAFLLWHTGNDEGIEGWTHGDNTATATPHFHVDTYHALPGGTYSWWCGEFDPSYTGGEGYGNNWDDRLNLPPLGLDDPVSTYPVLTFKYRHDTEPEFDFTWVQAESLGVFVNINRGYDGPSGGWQDIGVYGFVVLEYDRPLKARFRFVSDAIYSDEDGVYDSDGGAFHVDDIKVFDYFTGHVYFFDDVEDGTGLCEPGVPASAGDYWHLIDRLCPAISDPHCWWCGDDADTSLVPPGLDNWLMSPMDDLSGAMATTLRFIIHAEVPLYEDDYWTEEVTMDGGETWYSNGAFWGDYEQCQGWSLRAIIEGINLVPYVTEDNVFAFRITMHTNEDGCGPGAAGGAGVFLDDLYVEGYVTPVEMSSWARVKAMYRN